MQFTLLVSMGEATSGAFLGYLFVCFIVFIIGVFITRWIFGIPTIIGLLKAQNLHLSVMRRVISKLAQKQGVSEEEIKQIISEETNR